MSNANEQFESNVPELSVSTDSESSKRRSQVKRMFAKKVTSLYISDTTIKVTVVHGDELEQWVTAELEPNLVVNGVVMDPDGVAAKLKDLFNDHEIRRDNVIVGLSGIHGITRFIDLPNVPLNVLDEAIYHEAERELPVTMDTVYLSWQIIKETYQDMTIFLVAYARNTIDPLIDALQKAEIKPAFLELAPLALTRNVDSPTSIVFDVRSTEMDIVVLIDNLPILSRSIPIPFDNSIEENGLIILDELERTISFYASMNSTENLRIFGFGDLDPQTYELLSSSLNHPINSSPLPLYYPPEFSPNTHGVNLGLAMGDIKPLDVSYARRVRVNLLPETLKEKKLRPEVLAATGVILAVGILVICFFQLQSAWDKTESSREQLASAEKILVELEAKQLIEQREVNTLAKRAETAASEWEKYSRSIATLESNQKIINDDLKLVLETLPPGMSLSSIQEGGDFRIQGKAYTKEQILEYTYNLEQTNQFSEIILSIQDKDESTDVDDIVFQMRLIKGSG
ncbi:MAG: pilus assembly protein PilM [Dehalococcoidales bacterium]|nr:MAG: pilus assembly protein PilM [Dehalococcoidales bacterium]